MSAPANSVAVSRAVENEVNIGNPFCSSWRPTIGPMPITMQGACQFENVVIFQCLDHRVRWTLRRCSPDVGNFYHIRRAIAGG